MRGTSMTFSNLLPKSVCGRCEERPRPPTVQRQNAMYWDFVLGCHVECPDCGNVFEPGTWNPEGDEADYIHSGSSEQTETFGRSILENYNDV